MLDGQQLSRLWNLFIHCFGDFFSTSRWVKCILQKQIFERLRCFNKGTKWNILTSLGLNLLTYIVLRSLKQKCWTITVLINCALMILIATSQDSDTANHMTSWLNPGVCIIILPFCTCSLIYYTCWSQWTDYSKPSLNNSDYASWLCPRQGDNVPPPPRAEWQSDLDMLGSGY